jgi:hypothetical protein
VALTQHPEVTDPHPWPDGFEITDPQAAQVAAALPPVLLQQLRRARAQELSRWLAQGDWNSRLRVGQTGRGSERALYLTQPRRFGAREAEVLPPQALLDATGDEEVLARLVSDGDHDIYLLKTCAFSAALLARLVSDGDHDAPRKGAIHRRRRATSRCAPASAMAKRA